ncbi:hypothetical protein GCM10025867_17620 [Frondihabitans sucicola]|uniref:Uncharacterized protein n=1 Tax=Frondihabitans sucicola TaxID=1268041 RepID=A0ABM8GM91_9MICO|nr:hypothetical protein [Frondihabitans sucicola]BDZ49521.1 hypothetical protein GCM10025867_17620 [Frondihabitans sucicola]
MVQTAESPRLDSRVALVGGAGVVVAHLILLRPFGWWYGEAAGLIVAVALFVGFAVIAFGLPGAGAGLLGPSRLARWALFVSGALAVVGVVAAWFFPRGSVDFSSAGVRAFGIVLGCVSSPSCWRW